jgi:hypothetical protein
MSDGSGVQISDVSGASYLDQGPTSDEARMRIESVAAALVQSVRSGQVAFGSSSVAVPRHLVDVLLVEHGRREGSREETIAALVGAGLSQARASVLVDAMTRLLASEPVDVARFIVAVNTFNGVIEAAPSSFLESPPDEFLAIHAVLAQLLVAAS